MRLCVDVFEAATKTHWLVAGDDDEDFAMTDIVAPTLVVHGTTDPEA